MFPYGSSAHDMAWHDMFPSVWSIQAESDISASDKYIRYTRIYPSLFSSIIASDFLRISKKKSNYCLKTWKPIPQVKTCDHRRRCRCKSWDSNSGSPLPPTLPERAPVDAWEKNVADLKSAYQCQFQFPVQTQLSLYWLTLPTSA